MSDQHRGTPVGTALFPERDIPPAGSGITPRPADAAGRLRSLPRRRRPMVIALAVAMAATGVVVSAAIYQRTDHQVPVVMVTQPVPAGAVITASDLGTTSITVGSGIAVIPAGQLGRVTGEVAAVALPRATLLSPSDLATSRPPASGQELLAAPIRPAGLPVSGLEPGDHVLVVATPGVQGQPGAQAGAPSLAAPAGAVVEAVTSVPDSAGFDVIDLLVSDADAVAVADQVSTGQFALLITSRG